MFEVTAVLGKMNIFLKVSLLVGNARHGYISRLRDFPRGHIVGYKMSGLVLTEIDRNLWSVFGQEQLSLIIVQIKIKVVDRDGR